MRKKWISVLISLFMVFNLVPATASAATYVSNVYVGGTKVNTGGTTYWKSDGNGGITSTDADASNYVVKFEKPSGSVPELTLRGVILTAVYSNSYGKYGIYADGDLNIYLAEGKNNSVTGAANSGLNSYGIGVEGTLGVFGIGNLETSGGIAGMSCGIYSSGGLTIGGPLNISTVGGTADESYGIKTSNFFTFLGGYVTAKSNSPSGTPKAMNLSSIIGNATIKAGMYADGTNSQIITNQNLNIYKYLNLYMYVDTNSELLNYASKIIERGSYTLTQDSTNTEAAVKTALATQINALPGMNTTGITVAASDITVSSFKAATTGTSMKPAGTNGSFSFIVSLMRGTLTQNTAGKSETITATAFTNTMAVTAAKTAIVNGTVTVDFGADQTVKTTAVQNYVNSKLTGDAAGVTATVTHSSGNTYQVALSKGAVYDNKSITMTIKENANPDIALVNSAKSIIESSSYTLTQDTANTEAVLKTTLAAQINARPGMSATGITVTASDITLSYFNAATTGTSVKPEGTNGVFTFSVSLTKGVINQTTTGKSVIITATAFTNTMAVTAAKTAIVNGTVTVAFGADQTAKTAAVQSYVNSKLTGDAVGVTATVTHSSGNTYQVALRKWEVTDSKAITMTINENANPDIALVASAKSIIEGGSYTLSQATANTEAAVKTALATQINALPGMSATGVTVTASDLTVSSFNAATAGSSVNPAGTNGSFTFTVSLTKGVVNQTTTGKSVIITATAFTNTMAVTAAKTAIVNGTVTVDFGADQTAKTAAVQNYVNSMLTGDAVGVTATVTHSSGSTYQVALSKGAVYDNLSITMTINENANPDIALVNSAKSIIEGASYTLTQGTANTATAVKTALAAQINALPAMSATGVTVTADNLTVYNFVGATAGNSVKPTGTNGSFTFTVSLTKGVVGQTTIGKSAIITATAFTNTMAVTAAKTAIVNGTVIVDFGADQTAKTAAVQNYVNSKLTGDAAGVTATVTHSSGSTYQVALSKGAVNDSKSITMTINENANPDIALVNSAKSIIEGGSYTLTQDTANTEAAVKTALAAQINALPAMSTTGVTVTADNFTVYNFVGATAGTSVKTAGTNGSFNFSVSLTKGVVNQTTTGKSVTITATAFTNTMAVSAAKTAIVNGTVTVDFGADQTAKTAAVQNYVNSKLTGDAAGVTATVTHSSGSTYQVVLSKGAVNDGKSITMTINENANPDIALVNSAKSIIEGGSYTLTQATANTEAAVKTALATQINALSDMKDTGVTVTASDIALSDFAAPVAGTSGKPAGKNGSFTFTVSLTKGAVKQTTTGKSVTITATLFTGVTDAEAVAAAKAAIVNGTVTVDFGADQTAKTAAVQNYVNSKLTGKATGVTATVTSSIDNTYEVLLKKGEETYLKPITMTINENANPDIAKVNSAKAIIEAGSYTLAQTSVSTGGAIQAAIAGKISTLTGMSSTTVAVTGSSISVSIYIPAQEGTPGTPAGKNGSFIFSVSLVKGEVNETTVNIPGIITATPYTGLTDVAAVEAAKSALVNGTVTVDFDAQQTTKTAAVQNYVNNLLTGDAAGVIASVTHSSGNSYLVTLRKGDTTDSKTITMTINENANPDSALVEEAKTIVAGGSYTMSQAAANTETAVKTALAAQINALPGMSSKGVTVTASDITITQFTASVTGTSGNIAGTNGSFTFSVSLTKGVATTVMTGKTGTITATTYVAPSGGNNPPAAGGGAGAPVKKEGKIEKDQKQEGNAPTANLMNSTEDLKAMVLSAADQEQMTAGKDVKVILKVQDISASVSAEDKKQIVEKLATEQQNTTNPTLLYIDISLFKKVGDEEETRVTETSGKIKISVEVPASMWSTETGVERTYRVVRIHNGVTEILEGTYDPATHLFTFETDRFSTYALTYQDLNMISVDMKQSQAGPITVVQDFNHLRLTAKADKTSQKLTYAKVTGADGYLIYGAQYGKKLKKLADVDGKVRNYTVKKLKKGTYYTYQVKAYKLVDGKKVTIAESSLIYSVTTSKTYGNPTKLVIKKSSITLAVGETKKVTCQVVLPENKKRKEFASSTCFETTNQEIAAITNRGIITAKAKGTCYVYVYAQNGIYKKIKITVE